jgi:hypothetical protein
MALGRDKVSSSDTTGGTTQNVPRKLPRHEEIELAAYQLYVERGGTHGNAEDDWLQAERDLMEEFEMEPARKSRAKGA